MGVPCVRVIRASVYIRIPRTFFNVYTFYRYTSNIYAQQLRVTCVVVKYVFFVCAIYRVEHSGIQIDSGSANIFKVMIYICVRVRVLKALRRSSGKYSIHFRIVLHSTSTRLFRRWFVFFFVRCSAARATFLYCAAAHNVKKNKRHSRELRIVKANSNWLRKRYNKNLSSSKYSSM